MTNQESTHFSCTIDGSVRFTFPVSKDVEPLVDSYSLSDLAVEYYLLARYAYFHQMNSAFMINSFWAVEYMILAILCLKHTKESLGKDFDFHKITGYWTEAKSMVPEDRQVAMTKFDTYIGRVQGYYAERYPTPVEKLEITHTGEMPGRIRQNIGGTMKRPPVGRVAPLSIDDLDQFVNFMLHDIVPGNDTANGSTALMARLVVHENTELYAQENKYSIVLPNKRYHGEMPASPTATPE
jgi:hypothetical protein